MTEYRTGPHTVYDIQYHFVWVTKYRYHVLTGEVAERARELILQSCLSREIKIIKGHVSKDHMHILASCPPKFSPAKVMQYLKGRSSRLLQEEFPHLKKKYWGKHFWGIGYGAFSAGNVTDETVQEYIAEHEKHGNHNDDNFKVE